MALPLNRIGLNPFAQSLAQRQFRAMFARVTRALRAPGGTLIPKGRLQRKLFWSALFQMTVLESFGGYNPDIAQWQNYAKAIKEFWEETKPDKPTPAGFESNIYTAFQFWNASGERVTAFALNRRMKFLSRQRGEEKWKELWSSRWRVMRLATDDVPGARAKPQTIGNIVVARVDEEHASAENYFKFYLGQDRNWTKFDRLVTELKLSDYPAIIDDLEIVDDRFAALVDTGFDPLASLDIPADIIERIFFSDLSAVGRPGFLHELLKGDEEEQARTINWFVTDRGVDREIWNRSDVVMTLRYLAAYIYRHYYNGKTGDWTLTLEDLKAILVNNIAVCSPTLFVRRRSIPLVGFLFGRDDIPKIVPQYQYCIPVWNSSTSYIYVASRVEVPAQVLTMYREFAQLLFYLCWVVDSREQLEDDRHIQSSQATSNARAAILARNFSHSIGSHVLASAGFSDALNPIYRLALSAVDDADAALLRARKTLPLTGGKFDALRKELNDTLAVVHKLPRPRELERFLSFLQGRFDYIAGAISDRRYLPNAAFFRRDLLEPLLTQTAYLEHFVSDLDWKLEDLEFQIHIRSGSGRSTVAYTFEPGELGSPRFVMKQILGNVNEVTVSMPTSMSGRHAFYSLIENFIRNGMKYSAMTRTPGDRYVLSLLWDELEDEQRFYLWDSRSDNATAGAVKDITTFLEEPLIDDVTLALRPRGLGVKEMRLSAEVLGGDLRHARAASALRLCSLEERAALALSGNARIVYTFSTPRPFYVAMLGEAPRRDMFRWLATIDDVAMSGARVLALDGDRLSLDPVLLREVLHKRALLPFRTFAVCSSDEVQRRLEERLRAWPEKARLLPHVVDAAGGVHALVSGRAGDAVRLKTRSGLNSEQTFVIDVMELWLRAWKGPPPRGRSWHLLISLQRELPAGASWPQFLKPADGRASGSFSSPLISIALRCDRTLWLSNDCEPSCARALAHGNDAYWTEEAGAPSAHKRALVIDNHAAALANHRLAPRSYFSLEGQESPELYQEIASPPSDGFNFHLFALELVESALFQVAIVDERIDPLAANEQTRAELEMAGVFPARLVVDRGAEGLAVVGAKDGRRQVDLDSETALVLSLTGDVAASFGKLERSACDVLILHEGRLEMALSAFPGLNISAVFKQIYEGGVLLVTTTGRGNDSRYAESASLFLEASSLQASLVASRNKLALFRYVTTSITTGKIA